MSQKIIFLIAQLFCLPMHPIHVSVTNIEYNLPKQGFDVSVKLFIDDFEEIIRRTNNEQLNIGKENESQRLNELAQSYLSKNLSIEPNASEFEATNLVVREIKANNLEVWFYLHYQYESDIETITIHNRLLNDLYFDQTNLVIFSYKEIEKGIQFNYDKTSEIINIAK